MRHRRIESVFISIRRTCGVTANGRGGSRQKGMAADARNGWRRSAVTGVAWRENIGMKTASVNGGGATAVSSLPWAHGGAQENNQSAYQHDA